MELIKCDNMGTQIHIYVKKLLIESAINYSIVFLSFKKQIYVREMRTIHTCSIELYAATLNKI
jgi:hypothetical protein